MNKYRITLDFWAEDREAAMVFYSHLRLPDTAKHYEIEMHEATTINYNFICMPITQEQKQ